MGHSQEGVQDLGAPVHTPLKTFSRIPVDGTNGEKSYVLYAYGLHEVDSGKGGSRVEEQQGGRASQRGESY